MIAIDQPIKIKKFSILIFAEVRNEIFLVSFMSKEITLKDFKSFQTRRSSNKKAIRHL